MISVSTAFPDLTRTDVGVVLSSVWSLGTPERQRAAAEVIVDTWRDRAWPTGLLSYSIYVDIGGDLLMHYSQWIDEAAFDAFTAAERDPRVNCIDAAVPDIERRDLARYRIYRGGRTDSAPTPGVVVAVRVDTDGAERSRMWIDAVLDALANDDGLPDGGIGAYFHISTDGTKVLNYAEWISEEAHRAALAAGDGGISFGPHWERVQSMEGVRQVSVKRFHLYRTLTSAGLPG